MATTWTEANFLERLQAPLKSAYETNAKACPDAETMAAFADETANEFVRRAVTEHLKTCAECTELAERLTGFDAATAEPVMMPDAAAQAEWPNAEKRLAIAADTFARTAEIDFKRAARVTSAAPATAPAERATEWQVPWGKTAWSAVTVAVLVGAGFLLMRKQGAAPDVASVSAPNSNTPANAVTAPPDATGAKPAVEPPMVVANEGGANAELPPSVTTETPKSGGHAAIAGTKRSGLKQRAAASSSAAEVASSAAGGAAAPSASEDSNAATKPETASNAATSAGANVAPPAMMNGTSSTAVSSRSAHAATAGRKAPTGPVPDAIHVAAGTRVWIVLKNVQQTGDDKFLFVGNLLEPVSGNGTTALAKDTEIEGTGVILKGKASLHLEEIVVGGVRFALKGAGGAANSKAEAGSGSAVAFNAGQVQEMWISSAADYEKVEAGGGR